MSAFIVHSEHLTAGAHEADWDAPDDYTERRILGKVTSRAGTRPGQRSCRTTLNELAKRLRGDVVNGP